MGPKYAHITFYQCTFFGSAQLILNIMLPDVSDAWSIGCTQICIRGGTWRLLELLSSCDACVHDFNNIVNGDHMAKPLTSHISGITLATTQHGSWRRR